MTAKFSQRLKERRELMKLSRKEFAEILATSEQQIWRYERGINEPNVSTLIKFCELLAVSPEWLLGMVDGEIVIHPTEKNYIIKTPIFDAHTRFQELDNLEAEIVHIFRTKTLSQRKTIIEIAKLLKDEAG